MNMNETKHTPGPWEAIRAKDSHNDKTISIRGNREFIATMDTVSFDGGPYRLPSAGEANARLIAAAPDLLAALHRVMAEHEASDEPLLTLGTLRVMREAIARAEGGAA